jgi:O-antigen/teichoic acid export membrane protein
VIRRVLSTVKSESLYTNSLYIMSSSAATAALGFLFWLFSSHLYSAENVGLAASLMSAMALVSYISLLGFNSTFIRYLPTSRRPVDAINTGLWLVLGAALIASISYVALIPSVAPSLRFVHDSLVRGAGFIAMSALAAINFLTDSIFVAFRSAKYNLAVYLVMGLVRLILPATFLTFGAYGLYTAAGVAALVGLVLSLYLMTRLFDYRIRFTVSGVVVRQVFRFSSGNYLADLIGMLPPLVLPLIVVNKLGAADAGYYYLTFMLVNLVYAASYAIAQALFAEGSHADRPFGALVRRAVAVMAVVIGLTTVALLVTGPWVLLLFGADYRDGAGRSLEILVLAAPFVAVYAMVTTLLRVGHQTSLLVVVHVVYTVSIVGLAHRWASDGLPGIAAAWLVGDVISGALGAGALVWIRWRDRRRPLARAAA